MNNPAAEPLFHRLRTIVVRYCMGLLLLFITVEIIELTYGFGRAVFVTGDHPGRLLISSQEMSGLVPVFLNILISLELIETLRVYLKNQVVQIQLILLVGLTAITRHLLTADLFHGEPALNLSLAGLVVAIATAYFLIGRSPEKALS
jgi:uncharacterized membrane protein (DUF373 family)